MSLKVLYCLQKSAFVALKGFFDMPNVQQSCHSLPEHIIEEEWLFHFDNHCKCIQRKQHRNWQKAIL
jgi:hypothetical protein